MVGLLSENRRSLVYGLTDGMQLIADCFASLERIEAFLLIEELNGNGKEGKQWEEKPVDENSADDRPPAEGETTKKSFLKVRLGFERVRYIETRHIRKTNCGFATVEINNCFIKLA